MSLNFDTLGIGTCAGTEVNVVRSLATLHNSVSGSQVIYATTDGPGPNNITAPAGGNVWVTTNAAAINGTTSSFANVTLNGPGGASINSNQFPISSVAIDLSDPSGSTAYVTVMGFTGGPGHIWQTTNAGASWTDFTGTAANSLPDSPVNAVVVDASTHIVYVGTDVGVYESPTSGAAWREVGAVPSPTETGYLPNVAVTALGIFDGGGQKLLRASTYGRGIWQFNLLAPPDFEIAVSPASLTVFPTATAPFTGTLTAVNGYTNSVALSCTAGSSPPPNPCDPTPVIANWAPTATFSLKPGTSVVGDYNFNVQGAGSDPNNTTHISNVTLHVISIVMSTPSPAMVNVPRGATSLPVSFQVAAQGSFSESVTLSCSFTPAVAGGVCSFTPSATVNPTSSIPVPMMATVTVPGTTAQAAYLVTLQATTSEGLAPLTASFNINVVSNPDFVPSFDGTFPNLKAGSTGATESIKITPQDGFTGAVNLTCVTSPASSSCSIDPASVSPPYNPPTLKIDATSLPFGTYQLTVTGTSGSLTNSASVNFNVGDYGFTLPSDLVVVPGAPAVVNFTLSSENSYSGQVGFTCDVSALPRTNCVFNPPSPVVVGTGARVPVTVTVTVPSNAAAGSYPIKINTQDAGGEPNHSQTTQLTVQDFTLGSAFPSTQSIGSGGTANYTVSVAATPAGASFSNPVTLTCNGAPANSTCALTPASVIPGKGPATVTVTVTTLAAVLPGNYSISVTGASGALSHAATASLTIANSLQLAVTQGFPSSADAGSQQSAQVLLTPNYSGKVTASCNASKLPAALCTLSTQSSAASGSAISFPINGSMIPSTAVPLTATIDIPNSAVPGPYNIEITVVDASSGAPTASSTLPLTVAQDYIIANLSTAPQTIAAGQSITYNLSIVPVGVAYSNPVTLSCTGTPLFSGSCSFSPNPTSPLSQSNSAAVVMTITTKAPQAQLWIPGANITPWLYGTGLVLSAAWLWSKAQKRRCTSALALGMALALMLFLLSCGGGASNGGKSVPSGTPPGVPITYTVTVVGSPASISQPAGSAVTLIVE